MMLKQGRAWLNFERVNFPLILCQMEDVADKNGSILVLICLPKMI